MHPTITRITRTHTCSRPSCPWPACRSAFHPDLLTVIPVPRTRRLLSDASSRLILYLFSHFSLLTVSHFAAGPAVSDLSLTPKPDTHSPLHALTNTSGIKCPVCSKTILTDDVECHLVMCLTKPRISYNEDVLKEQKGECVICLEDMDQGDTIARLPCLCIYHKRCIDDWFQVNRSCPEHPAD